MKFTNLLSQLVLPVLITGQNIVNDVELIRHINSVQDSWVSHESPRFINHNTEHVENMCGVLEKEEYDENDTSDINYVLNYFDYKKDTTLPKNFDTREQWSDCHTISTIRDQSNCGSCWAFASTEAFNDRLCIASNGKFQTLLSPQDTLGCCGYFYGSMGCNGGQPSGAWRFFKEVGIVSGGEYGDTSTCLPYTYTPANSMTKLSFKKECFTDVLGLVKDVQKLISDYSSQDYTDLLKDVILTSTDILDAMGDCSSKDLESICLTDLHNVLNSLRDIIDMVDLSNFKNPEAIFYDITNVYTNITTMSHDCVRHIEKTEEQLKGSDKCTKTCSNENYETVYKQDKHKAMSSYSLSSVENIQKDLMTYGPLSMAFTVYADFPTYKSGVYHHVSGGQLGGHAVKLVGWGTTDDGEDYWIINNSWGYSWGENGSFRIRRGVDECGIESMSVDAGLVSYYAREIV